MTWVENAFFDANFLKRGINMRLHKKLLCPLLATTLLLGTAIPSFATTINDVDAASNSTVVNTIDNSQSATVTLDDLKKAFPNMKKISEIPEGVEPITIRTAEDLDKAINLATSFDSDIDHSTFGVTGTYQSSGGYNLGDNTYETYLKYKINSFSTMELTAMIQYYTSNPNKPKDTLQRDFRVNGLTPGIGFTGNTPSVTTTSDGNVKVTGTGTIKTYALIEADWFELSSQSVTMYYTINDHIYVTDYSCRIR